MRLEKQHFFLFILISLPLIILLIFFDPIKQSLIYHNFADKKTYIKIFNFHNVMSNILFLVFPIIGFRQYLREKKSMGLSWTIFLAGVFLVGPGSAYYHFNPNNQTLVWDRLPMTVAFMGLISFAFSEVFQIKREKLLLLILLNIGFYSILHWIYFNDLRIYAWVQLTPILAIFYMAMFLPAPSLKPKYLGAAVLFYLLAKLMEHFDVLIYNMLGYSGHSLKHLLAAFTVYSLIEMRRPPKQNIRSQNEKV